MYSMARPSRLVRESATTIRYCGLRILPIRRSRIFTATVCSLLNHLVAILARHRGVGADGARVDWRRARVRGRRTRAGYQQAIVPDRLSKVTSGSRYPVMRGVGPSRPAGPAPATPDPDAGRTRCRRTGTRPPRPV